MLDIHYLVDSLRAAGTDSVSVEVKSAEGGLPMSMASTTYRRIIAR